MMIFLCSKISVKIKHGQLSIIQMRFESCHAHISSAVSCRNGLHDVHDEESPLSMITLNRLESLQ